MRKTKKLNKSLLPFRKNVASIVIKKGKFLLVQLNSWPENYWKFPQGGLEESEDEEEGVLRELFEELGTKSFNILGKSNFTNTYNWPDDIIEKVNCKWRGQHQKFFLVEFHGKDDEITTNDVELRTYRWVNYNELIESIDHKNKLFANYMETILNVLNEFEEVLTSFDLKK